MTQEQDIVERLNDPWQHSEELCKEAAQTIAALRAERDELEFLLHEGGTMEEQLSKAEARVKELEHYEELWLGMGVK